MAKRDFMTELAREVEEQKSGKRDHIDSIVDFTSSHPLRQTEPEDYEEISAQIDAAQVKKPSPAPKGNRRSAEIPQFPEKELTMEDAYASDGEEPDSFQEEKREKIDKPRRTIRPVGIVLLLALLCLIGGLVYYFVFAPKIVVGNFVGNNVSEVTTWAKQNKMETSAIAKKEEYSLEYDKDIVIEQSVSAGEKIKASTPFTVTVSLGANPNDAVDFPADLKSMTLGEIKDWISENKLSKTKVTTQYSNNVPEGEVISYELKNTTESEFTRGATLNIICSKGQAPAGQIAVENFVGKTFVEMSTWANNKKVLLEKQESYSDNQESGIVMSMDKKAGDTIAEGSTIVVVVSKGKGIKIPNLVGYTKEQLDAWQASRNNTVTVITKSVHNAAAEGTVIGQSIPAGEVVDSGEVLELTISLYLPILETNSRQWLGQDYLQLKAWVDEANSKGASIQAGQYAEYQWNTCSDEYPTPGQIIEYGCLYGTSDLAEGCGRPLNLNSRIAYKISTGACEVTPPAPEPTPTTQIILNQSDMQTLSSIQAFCQSNGLHYEIKDSSKSLENGATVAIEFNGNRLDNVMGQFPVVLKSTDEVYIYWTTVPSPTPEPSGEPDPSPTPTPETTQEP